MNTLQFHIHINMEFILVYKEESSFNG